MRLLTQDVDNYLTHMNNTRLASEMNLAAYYFIYRTVLLDLIVKNLVWKSAFTLRFRKPVPLFSIYKINTKVRINTYKIKKPILIFSTFFKIALFFPDYLLGEKLLVHWAAIFNQRQFCTCGRHVQVCFHWNKWFRRYINGLQEAWSHGRTCCMDLQLGKFFE